MDYSDQSEAIDRDPAEDRAAPLSARANTSLTAAAGGGAAGAVAGVMTGVSVGVGSVGAAVAFPMLGLLVGAMAAGGIAQIVNHSRRAED